MLGDDEDTPPIGLIQSAIGGTQIEVWSPNATTAECQNKTAGGPTAGPPKGALYYGMGEKQAAAHRTGTISPTLSDSSPLLCLLFAPLA